MDWKEHDIRVLSQARAIVARLHTGEIINLRTGMGSCQCGDIYGKLFVEDGVLMAETTQPQLTREKYGPQPAARFGMSPGYGMGRTIKLIAYIYAGEKPDVATLQYAFGDTAWVRSK